MRLNGGRDSVSLKGCRPTMISTTLSISNIKSVHFFGRLMTMYMRSDYFQITLERVMHELLNKVIEFHRTTIGISYTKSMQFASDLNAQRNIIKATICNYYMYFKFPPFDILSQWVPILIKFKLA